MTSVLVRSGVRVTGALLACVALLAAGQVAAGAKVDDGPRVIAVDVTTDGGFSLPAKVHSGPVTFRFSSPESSFHAVQGFYLRPGATLDQVYEDFANALSGVPELVVAGMQGLDTHIVAIGGAVTSPFGTQEVTIPLDRGRTYWLDLADIGVVSPPRTHVLGVNGQFKNAQLPTYSAVFEATMDGDDPVFRGPSTFPHDGTFLGVVTGDELHEIVFRPVRTDIPGFSFTTPTSPPGTTSSRAERRPRRRSAPHGPASRPAYRRSPQAAGRSPSSTYRPAATQRSASCRATSYPAYPTPGWACTRSSPSPDPPSPRQLARAPACDQGFGESPRRESNH